MSNPPRRSQTDKVMQLLQAKRQQREQKAQPKDDAQAQPEAQQEAPEQGPAEKIPGKVKGPAAKAPAKADKPAPAPPKEKGPVAKAAAKADKPAPAVPAPQKEKGPAAKAAAKADKPVPVVSPPQNEQHVAAKADKPKAANVKAKAESSRRKRKPSIHVDSEEGSGHDSSPKAPPKKRAKQAAAKDHEKGKKARAEGDEEPSTDLLGDPRRVWPENPSEGLNDRQLVAKLMLEIQDLRSTIDGLKEELRQERASRSQFVDKEVEVLSENLVAAVQEGMKSAWSDVADFLKTTTAAPKHAPDAEKNKAEGVQAGEEEQGKETEKEKEKETIGR
ncbi:hypothetical protein FKP32DRAFT_1605527 [Trametes sanguinea]|nr:hypothetical protein FKP32DRAFT_1605527 [Trametes sanguinea]